MTRSTGSPSRPVANTSSQAARVAGSSMPQSTMLQPSRAGSPPSACDPVAQQPEVDVVERERQAHAHPANAGRDLDRAPGLGSRGAEAIVELGFQGVHRSRLRFTLSALYVNVNFEFIAMPRAVASRLPRGRNRPARGPSADVLDRRAGARVRADDAGDPLLRGLRPARAAARRPQPRLHGARPGAPDADAARQAARPEARRGEGPGRHVREPARHRRAAAPLPRRAGAASRPARGAPRPSCARRSTRCSRRNRRRSRCCASGRRP